MTRLVVTADADTDLDNIITHLQQEAGERVAESISAAASISLCDGLLSFREAARRGLRLARLPEWRASLHIF